MGTHQSQSVSMAALAIGLLRRLICSSNLPIALFNHATKYTNGLLPAYQMK